MSTSVRKKIRYSVVYPLRYASDKVRSYLSGAGSTLMALALGEAEARAVARRMEAAARKAGMEAQSFVVSADNRGMIVTVR